MIRYCRECLLPATKPDLRFDAVGVCQACLNYKARPLIDWGQRQNEFVAILEKHRKTKTTSWDCIVPVSGGKDSTFQVLTIKNLGYNPLAVTARTCDLSAIGRRNLDNLRGLGVDHIEIAPNPNVRADLNRVGLLEVGDISWAEHVGIFTIPVRASVNFGIPLIVWGENSQNEYGGPANTAGARALDRKWLEEFGGLLGMRVTDLVEKHELTEEDLYPYTYPSSKELDDAGTEGLFLGHFFPWDGLANSLISQANGFETWPTVIQGSAVNYENLDNYQSGIHDYFKYLKFGFGRASDLVSMHIRRGRVSREQGLKIIRELDGEFPWSYLEKSLPEILEPLGVTVTEFIAICDQFTNHSLFQTRSDGSLVKDARGNLTKINYDNIDEAP